MSAKRNRTRLGKLRRDLILGRISRAEHADAMARPFKGRPRKPIPLPEAGRMAVAVIAEMFGRASR